MQIIDAVREKLADKISAWQHPFPKRIYFSVNPQDIRHVAEVLFRNLKLRFVIASGIDTPEGLEILYHFSFDKTGEMFSVRVLIKDKKNPQIDSLAVLFSAAEWIEREIWEMLGINFIGHPNLKRLLLPDEWPENNHPLRHES